MRRRRKTDRNARRVAEDLCWNFRPLPSQRAFAATQTRFKGFSGPVGSGKSAALCFEVVRQTFLNFGRQGLLAAPTYAMLRDATLASMFNLLEQMDLEFELKKSDGEFSLTAVKDGVVLLRSLEEPERLRGTNLAWFGIDELSYTREEGWLRLEARLRDPKAPHLCGFAVWTPQGHDWIYRRFIQKPVAGYGVVLAKPFENKHVLDRTPDYYERLENSYDPRFYRQEVLGEYINSRADRVYQCFNTAVHVVEHEYDRRRPLMWALDFNVSPMSSVLAQLVNEKLAVIDEIVLERATTDEACAEFANRYQGHLAALEVYGDASGRNMHTTGTSDYSMLQTYLTRAGFKDVRIKVPTSNPPVLKRVQRVNALLTNANGEVRLEVHPKCKELIRDFEEVLFKPDSGVIDKVRDFKRTHASDALGYLIWYLHGDKQTAGEMNRRLL